MNERRIVKVFPESSGESWRTRVMCDDGTTWEMDSSKYSAWHQTSAAAIPGREDALPDEKTPCELCGLRIPFGTLFTSTGTGLAHTGCYELGGVLSLVELVLSQHSEGPSVAAMRIAGNGPTIGEVVRRALAKKP